MGYEVDVPMSTFFSLPTVGEKVALLTHFCGAGGRPAAVRLPHPEGARHLS